MAEFENVHSNAQMAPWLTGAAFNNYYTYSFISRASFYAMINSQYYSFMNRFVQNWLWWYDGYVPYFHNSEQGIPSTHLATALVDRAARKVVGGRVMYKNAGKDNEKTELNPTLEYISTWAKETEFESAVKRAVRYAAAAGTALMKLNKDAKGLWAEALRFDSFLPSVDARGNLASVKCFLRYFTNLGVKSPKEGDKFKGYYIVEHRYFSDFKRASGRVIKNAPVVEYAIHEQHGSITNGEYISQSMTNSIEFRNLPTDVRRVIAKTCPDIIFNKPTLLPFNDSLGCELIKWTDGVSGIPELPLGESFLTNIISQLMTWDYYQAAANTDMYTGRARVMVPKQMRSATGNGAYNTGLDDFLFTQWQTPEAEKQTPTPLQFDLRSTSWTEIRNRLIQDISINTGLNISTIASFLQDTTAARTAREISTEENETAEYVNDKRAIIEKPLNKILRLVAKYKGYPDEVVIRWSGAGLTNRYTLAEIISMAVQGGFLSQYKAVQMFNYDDDDAQVQEEYERIVDAEAAQNTFDDFGGNEEVNDEENDISG